MRGGGEVSHRKGGERAAKQRKHSSKATPCAEPRTARDVGVGTEEAHAPMADCPI